MPGHSRSKDGVASLANGARHPRLSDSAATITIDPLANCPRADACGFGNGLRRLPARNLPYNPLSTKRREPGILVHVHPVLPRIAEASQLQLPRSGPGGQPNESSQLDDLGFAELVDLV